MSILNKHFNEIDIQIANLHKLRATFKDLLQQYEQKIETLEDRIEDMDEHEWIQDMKDRNLRYPSRHDYTKSEIFQYSCEKDEYKINIKTKNLHGFPNSFLIEIIEDLIDKMTAKDVLIDELTRLHQGE